MNARMDTQEACDLRFGQVGIANVRVRRADAAALCDELERRVRAAPQLFSRAAVVLDLSHLLNLPDDGTVDALLEAVRSEPEPVAAGQGAQHVDGTVRSGQQVYARERDLVVTGTVANGAEVIADGSIHIYGSLRGRAMAGAQGDEKARIYISDFRAELVAIAGHYRVFEQIPKDLEGQSVRCWLEAEKWLAATESMS